MGMSEAAQSVTAATGGTVIHGVGYRFAPSLEDLSPSAFLAPLFATAAQSSGRGWFLVRLIEVKPGERIRIGQELVGRGGPERLPAGWPGKPKKPLPPYKIPDDLNDYIVLIANWSQEFFARVWSFFDFYATFTADGEKVAENVKITEAFSEIVENKGEKNKAGRQGKHISAGFKQADLQNALNDDGKEDEKDKGDEGEDTTIEKSDDKVTEDKFWNDLEEIEVKPKPGKAGTPPDAAKGDTPDEKAKKEEVKNAVKAIKPGKLDATVKVAGKPKPKPKPK